jgi:hypothetical protein
MKQLHFRQCKTVILERREPNEASPTVTWASDRRCLHLTELERLREHVAEVRGIF